MTFRFTQPLTEMYARNLLAFKARPPRNDDNLTVVCLPIVQKMWDPRRLTILKASTACYGDRSTLRRRSVLPVRYDLDCKYR
jgi:hypothetical protein